MKLGNLYLKILRIYCFLNTSLALIDLTECSKVNSNALYKSWGLIFPYKNENSLDLKMSFVHIYIIFKQK